MTSCRSRSRTVASWNQALIDDGREHLRRATASRRPPGPYRLQAQIAACHATATDAQTTPWSTIVTLYDALLVAQRSPVIMLNRAIAIGFRDGYQAGLAELDALDPASSLAGYYLLPAARADFLRRLNRHDEARRAYQTGARLAPPTGPNSGCYSDASPSSLPRVRRDLDRLTRRLAA